MQYPGGKCRAFHTKGIEIEPGIRRWLFSPYRVHVQRTPCDTGTAFLFIAFCWLLSMIAAYSDREKWTRMSLLNTSAAGFFAADRSIKEYADKFWDLKPVH